MAGHPNKHIREAIRSAEIKGWRVVKAGPRAHIWGKLLCPLATQEGCIIRVYSTPRHAQNHARKIQAEVDQCPHATANHS